VIRFYIVLGTFLLHLVTLSRYGYFRDELYFIACARHLAWGYIDQPPLVAFAAWLAMPFGFGLIALRILPAIAAALAALVAVQIARDLGGGRFAQLLAGISVALLPAYMLLGNILTTTSFEALSWTLVVWLCIRLVIPSVGAQHRSRGAATTWIALALTVAFGLYGKYSMALLVAALFIGFIFTSERAALRTRWCAIAAGVCALLVLPNLIWQWSHGWPFLEVIAGDAAHRHAFNTGLVLESQNVFTNSVAFISEQLVYTNPLAAPIWIAALIAPFTWPRLRNLRCVSVAFVALLVAAIALEAKGYYIIGIYGGLLAIGAVVVERAASWLRTTALAALVATAVLTMPISLPVLPIQSFIDYSALLGMTGRDGTPPKLVQPIYAEEFGWKRLARDVATRYYALPPAVRAQTAIYADTYADAGAINFFGHVDAIPIAISSQNSYWLWGTHNYSGAALLAIGASRIDLLKQYYRSCTLLGTSTEPLKWAVEGPAPIYLCTQPTQSLDAIWPHLRWYGA
jgi:hypothetical protein